MLLTATVVWGQTDEIQVYDASHADPGVFNLTWHNNFIASGLRTPPFPGAVTPNRSWNGVTEWAYGVTPWFETGLYLPLYTIDQQLGAIVDGFKLRELFTVPHADDRRFFYGVNFEFSVNSSHWDAHRITSEVRPIVGWHLRSVDLVLNPIVDTAYEGLKNLDFAPAIRLAYHASADWVVAAEEYADYGPVHGFFPRGQQTHQLYAVIDHTVHHLEIEFGAGVGLTNATDRLTLKLLVSRDLNPH